MKKTIYTIVGLLLGLIAGYIFSLFVFGFIAGNIMHITVGYGRMFFISALIFGLVGGFKGYVLANKNYQFKSWQIFLVGLIFIGAIIYGIWLWNALGDLGKSLEGF